MRHLPAFCAILVFLCVAGCSEEAVRPPAPPRLVLKDQPDRVEPVEEIKLDLSDLEAAIAQAVKGIELVEREFKFNNFAHPARFRMMVPRNTKDDWLGGLKLDDGESLTVGMNLDTGFHSRPEPEAFDDGELVAKADNLIIFRERRASDYFSFRMIVPLGHLDVYATRGSSEKVTPTLRNCLIAVHCIRTIKPSMEIETDPIEAMRQLRWRVIERDGKVTEIHVDPETSTQFVTPNTHKLLWQFRDLERLTFPLFNDELCAKLAKFPKMQHLHIQGGHRDEISVKGLTAIAGMTSLRGLTIVIIGIDNEGVAPLAALKNLEQLRLELTYGSQLKGPAFAHVGKLTSLTALDLPFHAADDADIAHLLPLTGLRRLNLTSSFGDENPRIGDAAIAHLLTFKELRELILDHTAITDAGVLKLAALPMLRRLSVQGTKVTSEAAEELVKSLPQLKVQR